MIRLKHAPIITAFSLVVMAVMVGTVILKDFFKYDNYNKHDFIDPSTYQAVFLNNDQIYFGRLKSINSDYLILSDVYYVKVGESGAGQLLKLGTIEPHGPQDKMIINQDQVLFWENLRLDSQVVKTIQGLQLK